MHFVVTEDYQEMSRAAARLISSLIQSKPDASIIVAVGNTPLGTFRELAQLRKQGTLDTRALRPFQLDEYLVPPDDPRSLFAWVRHDFLAPLGIPAQRCVRLRPDASGLQAACQEYDRAVEQAGGFDIAILGLGPNGHLGFNEPPADPNSPAHLIDLTEASLVSNATYWGGRDQVPLRAMTCGMAHLLATRHLFLLVSGEHKRAILQRTVKGPVTPDVPASYLQHSAHVTVVADRAAWPQIGAGERE